MLPTASPRTGSYPVKGNENCTAPKPDLAITGNDLTFGRAQGNVVVVAVVHNLGTLPASNVQVQVAVDGAAVGAPRTIASIPAGGTGRVSVNVKVANGTHGATATADPANAIAESDEGNNSGSRNFTVQGGKVT